MPQWQPAAAATKYSSTRRRLPVGVWVAASGATEWYWSVQFRVARDGPTVLTRMGLLKAEAGCALCSTSLYSCSAHGCAEEAERGVAFGQLDAQPRASGAFVAGQ